MTPKILILDSDSSAGLESIQSLGRLGATIHAAASQPCLAFSSRYVHETTLHPVASEELASWISNRHVDQAYDLIVPVTERALMAFLTPEISEAAQDRAVLAPSESIRVALDKEKTRQFASKLGLLVPHSRMVTKQSSEPTQFPVVLKPVHSKRVRGGKVEGHVVTIARNLADWHSALQNTYSDIDVQEQEYVSGKGIGVEMLFNHGQPCWHFVHERLHEVPLTGGASSYRQAIAAMPYLIEPAGRLLRALSWHGAAMVEFKLTGDGTLYLVEINPRLWGSLALGIDAGVNFPAGLLSISLGLPVPAQPKYRVGYRTRNLASDLFWMRANLLADHSDPLLLIRPRMVSFLEYGRPLLGEESWDFFDIHDLGITFRSVAEVLSEIGKKLAAAMFRRVYGPIQSYYLSSIAQKSVLRALSRKRKRSILFLCYGNICRSPLAEALARVCMPEVQVASAGFHEREARPSPGFMQSVASSLSTDLSAHRSLRVVSRMIDDADVVVIMDRRNYADMKEKFPRALPKTVFLGMFADPPQLEVEDPYGLSFEDGLRIGGKISESVKTLANWMRL